MKAFPALRLFAFAALFSLGGVKKTSAQLFYHIVDNDSFAGVDSGNNLGVAINALFEFNYGSPGVLRLTLTNLAGTSRAVWGDGAGNYTTGILTGFGFDAPAGATYVAGSFTEALGAPAGEPGGIDFVLTAPYTQTNPVGNFDIGAASAPPRPANGLAGGGYQAIFTFQYAGDLTYFNPGGFFSHNGNDADFGFRYQAVGANGASDKFVYYVNDNPPIPEPSTYGLVGAAVLLGVVGYKRVRGGNNVAAIAVAAA